MSLNSKIALVTGASRGIGAAIATELASKGAAVVGTATTQEGADLFVGQTNESCRPDIIIGDSGLFIELAHGFDIRCRIMVNCRQTVSGKIGVQKLDAKRVELSLGSLNHF